MIIIANRNGQVTLLAAMAYQEGYGPPKNRPTRNNSPLDLITSEEATRFGATGADGRYAVFPTQWHGFDAARRWLSIAAHFAPHPAHPGDPIGPNGYLVRGYLGATLEQVIYRFAPKGDGANDPEAYVRTVVSKVTSPAYLTRTTVIDSTWLVLPDTLTSTVPAL